jgi:hypothetical protein
MTRDQFIARWASAYMDRGPFVRDLDTLLYSLPLHRPPEKPRKRPGSKLDPKALKIIGDMIRDAHSYREIAEHLNAIGLRSSRGGKFSPQTVRQYSLHIQSLASPDCAV